MLERSSLPSSSWGVVDLRVLWQVPVEDEWRTALRDALAGVPVPELSPAASEALVRSLQTRCFAPGRRRGWALCAAAARLPLQRADADLLASYPAASAAPVVAALLARDDHHPGRTLALTRHLWPLRGNALLEVASLPGSPFSVLARAGHPERVVTALLPLWRSADWDGFVALASRLFDAPPEALEVLLVLVDDELSSRTSGSLSRSFVSPSVLTSLADVALAAVA